mgnify:CR=1 FL=1
MIITSLCNELKMHHVERLSNGNCGLEEGTVYTDILNSFNRIAAHCASAMVALLKSGDDNPDMHIMIQRFTHLTVWNIIHTSRNIARSMKS